MKTAISIPDPIFQAAEQLAAMLRISRSELYSNAVAAFVAVYDSDHVTARLNETYDQEDSSLDPVLAAWQVHALAREEW